jgi:hypothetical protein
LGQVEVYHGVLGFGVDAGKEACRARFGAAVCSPDAGLGLPICVLDKEQS